MNRRVMLWASSIALVVGLCVATFGGYSSWQRSQRIEALRPPVKLTSIHLARILELQITPSNATFEEYFRKSSESLAEIDRAAIQVRSTAKSPPHNEERLALEYMARSQSVMRSLTRIMRERLAKKVAEDANDRYAVDAASSNEYTREYASKGTAKSRQAEIEALKKQLEEMTALEPLLQDLRRMQPEVSKPYGSDAVVDPALLKKVFESFGFQEGAAPDAAKGS